MSDPETANSENAKPNPMSRGAQTAWIVGTMLAIGFVAIGISKSGQDPKYPRCELGFMGSVDKECRGKEAVEYLMRR